MKKYLHLYVRMLKLSLMRAMAYPDDFVTWAIVDIAWAVVNIGFFRVLLFAIPEISGWTFEMLAVPLGIIYFLNAVIWGLLWSSMLRIPRDINKGELDMFLVKPANSQFLVSTRFIGINLLPSVIAGALLIWYGFHANHLPAIMLLVIPAGVFSASIISYAVWFMTTTLAFWFNRLLNIVHVFPHSVDVARYPVTIFHPFLQFLLTYIVPFALMAFLPAEVIFGRVSPIALLLPLSLGGLFLYLSHKFWNFSLKRYQSASS